MESKQDGSSIVVKYKSHAGSVENERRFAAFVTKKMQKRRNHILLPSRAKIARNACIYERRAESSENSSKHKIGAKGSN